MNIEKLVPPPEMCEKIPEDEFLDTAFCWHYTEVAGFICGNGCKQFSGKQWQLERSTSGKIVRYRQRGEVIFPAPTLEEILEDLHKNLEDVFLKWSEHAFNAWLINAYTFNKEDFQEHHKSLTTAAMKLWIKVNKKGTENGN
jgi:hypothetical protein